MPKLIITCGISGSGKSTYAAELVKKGWGEVNRDRWRFHLYCNGVEDWGLYKFTKDREKAVSEKCLEDWNRFVSENSDIVISDTNLDFKYHTYWKNLALLAGYIFEVKYFKEDLETLYKRDLRRGGKAVGRDVLNKQWKQWLKLTGRKTYNPTQTDRVNKKIAILVDIDRTIAKMGDRGPFDWKKVGVDTPRRVVISIIKNFWRATNAQLIFLSGRDSICRKETTDWLYDNFGFNISDNFKLYMRTEGDSRKDSIIKEELFWPITKDYNILEVFDDRPQVVRMWKDLGLTVIDVSEGYDEF